MTMSISDELRDRVLAMCRRGDRMLASVELRRATGWDLAIAEAWLGEQVPPPPRPTVSAAVYAFGSYHPSLEGFVEYPDQKRPSEGSRVSFLVTEAIGEGEVVQLAKAFGVDAFDLDAHALSPTRADFERLVATDRWLHPVEQMERLRERGFRFFLHVEPW